MFFVLCAEPGLQAQSSPSLSQPAGASIQDSANELSVAVGKTVLVDTARPMARIALGLAEVADAEPISPTEIMVTGKTPGETSLIIWDTRGGRQFFNVKVRASSAVSNDNLDAIRREIRTELPGEPVKVSTENGIIFLRGTVKNLNSSERAEKIASTGGKVVNLLNVNVPPADPQILLKVRFTSVDLSKELQLGINFYSSGFGNTIAGISTGQFSPPSPSLTTPSTVTQSSNLNLFAFLPGLNLGASLEALQQKGITEVLAEPNILASNGKEASFLAGGEYPFPMVQASAGGAGAITIMFKEYGVRLNFIATVTPRGTIRLQVAPEVSSLDFTQGIEISGFDVPSINTRKMKTEVELSDGQSFGIGGLLDNRDTEAFSKIPFLGDIPILGKLFQSMQKTKTKTELIVIVTPEIVAPIEAGAPLPELKYPSKFLPPNSGIPMNTPDAKTAANTLPPAPPSMPVEKLIDSMKPEQPLVVEGGVSFGGSSGSTAVAPASTPVPY
jgi:pilus assembly protein CpaC